MKSEVKPNACEPRKHHLNHKKSVLGVTTFKSMDRKYITLEKEKKGGKKGKRKKKSVCPSGI